LQRQIEATKRKASTQTAALKAAQNEVAALKHASSLAQHDLKQAAVAGPQVRKLEGEVQALKQALREAQAKGQSEAAAREQISKAAGHAEGAAEIAEARSRQMQVCCCCGRKELHLFSGLWMCTGKPSKCAKRSMHWGRVWPVLHVSSENKAPVPLFDLIHPDLTIHMGSSSSEPF
jgi:hypothetical protein